MKKIFISDSSFAEFDKHPMEMLREAGMKVILNPYKRKLSAEEIIGLAAEAEGIIAGTESLNKEVIENLKYLKAISRIGTGLDNVDLETAERLQVKVFNTPDAPVQAVCELTVGFILSLLRNICFLDRQMHKGLWSAGAGYLLSGKKIGVVGLGRIGKKVARTLGCLGAKIYYYDPAVVQENSGELEYLEFSDLLKKADIITLHLPLSRENHHLFGQKEFSLMKEGALFINTSRGSVVDEEALYSALKENKLAGAALDVFEKEPYNGPLAHLDNVLLTPHIASFTKETRIDMETQAVKNLLEGING